MKLAKVFIKEYAQDNLDYGERIIEQWEDHGDFKKQAKRVYLMSQLRHSYRLAIAIIQQVL